MGNASALGAIRRRWWIVVILAGVGALLGALPEPTRVEEQATTFTATHTLLLNNTDVILTGDTAVSPNQVSLLATTGEVPLRAAENVGFDGNPAELASQVTVTFDLSTGALTFTTTQDTAA